MPRKVCGRSTLTSHDYSYAAKRRVALTTAARAHDEKGSYSPSLDDIAAELNVTETARYDLPSKDEIPFECHSASIESITDAPLGGAVPDAR